MRLKALEGFIFDDLRAPRNPRASRAPKAPKIPKVRVDGVKVGWLDNSTGLCYDKSKNRE